MWLQSTAMWHVNSSSTDLPQTRTLPTAPPTKQRSYTLHDEWWAQFIAYHRQTTNYTFMQTTVWTYFWICLSVPQLYTFFLPHHWNTTGCVVQFSLSTRQSHNNDVYMPQSETALNGLPLGGMVTWLLRHCLDLICSRFRASSGRFSVIECSH